MAYHVLTRGPHRRPTATFIGSRPEIDAIDGPAVLFEADGGSVGLGSGTPIATREAGENWEPVQSHVSEAWVRLPDAIRAKLIADPDAEFDADELVALSRAGGLVSKAYWVGSEDDPGFRMDEGMREFVVLMASLPGE